MRSGLNSSLLAGRLLYVGLVCLSTGTASPPRTCSPRRAKRDRDGSRKPTLCRDKWEVLIHLKVVRCAQRRGLILVSQRLFGKVVKLLVLTFRLAGLLPKLVSAADDIYVGDFYHSLHL